MKLPLQPRSQSRFFFCCFPATPRRISIPPRTLLLIHIKGYAAIAVPVFYHPSSTHDRCSTAAHALHQIIFIGPVYHSFNFARSLISVGNAPIALQFLSRTTSNDSHYTLAIFQFHTAGCQAAQREDSFDPAAARITCVFIPVSNTTFVWTR
ncbi:hypothetical protein BDW22DRAFT_699839 [Trametopsis cervina]|nr:hypothetical protein BDW22DRAFT_699839 [Trametopsis cervina]